MVRWMERRGKPEELREAALKANTGFRWVKHGAVTFMRKIHDAEMGKGGQSDLHRLDALARRRGKEEMGVLPAALTYDQGQMPPLSSTAV